MPCTNPDYHGEHYYSDYYDADAWCPGKYEVLERFGVWRIVLDPDDPESGYIDTDPDSGLPTYYVDSGRVHERAEPGGSAWRQQMSEKLWA